MVRMHKERRGTASARITQLEAKTTKLGNTQLVLAPEINNGPALPAQPKVRNPTTAILVISQHDVILIQRS